MMASFFFRFPAEQTDDPRSNVADFFRFRSFFWTQSSLQFTWISKH